MEIPEIEADHVSPAAPQNLLVVQGTPYCNINCNYCYLADRNKREHMLASTFEKIVERVVFEGVFTDKLTVVWRSGEPLTLPIEFYKHCVAVTNRYADRMKIRHAIQTNGMLITPAWCEFFRECDILIGVSVDGPPPLHDKNRTDRCGNGTFRYVARGLAILEAFDIPFSITCVLTYDHLDYAKVIFEFFKTTGARQIILSVDEIKGSSRKSSFQFAPDGPARYRAFVKELLSLNEQSGFPISLPNITLDLLQPLASPINNEVTPWNIVAVDFEGNVSTFSPELMGRRSAKYNSFVLGNLLQNSVAEIVASKTYRQLIEDIRRGVDLCRAECDYFEWCCGGAPANKYFERGTFEAAETMYCRLTKKAVCDANLELLEQQLAATSQQSI